MSDKIRKKRDNYLDLASSEIIKIYEIGRIISDVSKNISVDEKQIIEILDGTRKLRNPLVPLSVFNRKISSLETVVKYLKENLGYRFLDIAKILNRSYSTIILTYKNSVKKFPKKLVVKELQNSFPVSGLRDRNYSVLESIVKFLKKKFTLTEISLLLKRDVRTIWTVNERVKKKRLKNA